MVTLSGVEPATCGLGNRRSIHLSYRATPIILTRYISLHRRDALAPAPAQDLWPLMPAIFSSAPTPGETMVARAASGNVASLLSCSEFAVTTAAPRLFFHGSPEIAH